jgi:hypothetical protein
MKHLPGRAFRHKFFALVAAGGLCAAICARGQTVFTVNNVGPIVSSGAYVSITSPNPIFQISGTTTNNITPRTIGTDIFFASPGTPGYGPSDPGYNFNGIITGSSIAAATTIPISYAFGLAKNATVGNTVSWTLSFSGSENPTPVVLASGTLTSVGAGAQTFSGSTAYSFTNGSAALGGATSTFTISLALAYESLNPGGGAEPLVSLTMANSGFGGQGVTLNAAAIPEPSTYAVMAGTAMLGAALWRRRRRANALA